VADASPARCKSFFAFPGTVGRAHHIEKSALEDTATEKKDAAIFRIDNHFAVGPPPPSARARKACTIRKAIIGCGFARSRASLAAVTVVPQVKLLGAKKNKNTEKTGIFFARGQGAEFFF